MAAERGGRPAGVLFAVVAVQPAVFPALCVPWSDVVEVQREHVAFRHFVQLHFRARPAVTLQLSERTVREIAAEANGAWADGRPFAAVSAVGS